MAQLVFYLLLIVLCEISAIQIQSEELKTEELDDPIQKQVNKLTDKAERREFKLSLQKWIKKDSLSRRAFLHFDCAVSDWKRVFETVFPQSPNVCTKKEISEMKIPAMPADIILLNKTNDRWIDEFDLKKNRVPTTPSLQRVYEQWYCRLTTENQDISVRMITLRNLLKKLESKNPQFYDDNNHIFVRFAANAARGWGLICTCQHCLVEELGKYFIDNPKESLTTTLFEKVPTWHISKELLGYVNILRHVRHNGNAKLQSKKIEAFHCRNRLNQITIVPFLYSDECAQVSSESVESAESDNTTLIFEY